MAEAKKLVIMGVENAGKSTIVDLLLKGGEEGLINPPDMNPTRGVQRVSLVQENIIVWDFGGQGVYRNEYIANPEIYFQKISLFYYVVDVQDHNKIYSSAMYFKAIFGLIRKYSPNAGITFLFHKMDPDFNPSERNLKGKFLEKVEPYFKSNNMSYLMFETTIFDLSSIKTAFNQMR